MMTTSRRLAGALWLLTASGACSSLEGLGGPAPPLVSFAVQVDGDVTPLWPAGVTDTRSLQVALVWGAQWQTEPFCVLPAESPDAAAVIAAGCRDPLGFVPIRVAASVPVTPGARASLSLFDLPGADVMVGTLTGRIAYGSLVVYDDRDGDGTLGLATPHRARSGRGDRFNMDTVDSTDVVYGASFLTMTKADQRVAFREGAFDRTSAFEPRIGCDDPPRGFSVLSAGGFTVAEATIASALGQLPAEEDPAKCGQAAPADALIEFGVQAPDGAREVSCVERTNDSSIRYREPPADAPEDLSDRLMACVHLPSFDAGNQSSLIQLVVSGRSGDRCKSLTHYTLRGCRENVACALPDWDYTANTATAVKWWPCLH
jgi:hypothetical protein